MSNIGIYTVTSPTGKIYVGQSINLHNRKSYYRRLKCKQQVKLYNSIKKHGWDQHRFDVVISLKENTPQFTMNQLEQVVMNYYRSQGVELINLREAGHYGKMSEETKNKMSATKKGKVFSEAHLANLRKTREKNLSLRPIKPPKEKKPRKIRIGKDNPSFKGYVTAYKDGGIVGVYEGVLAASKALNMHHMNICDILNGKQKQAKGYTFTREPLQK